MIERSKKIELALKVIGTILVLLTMVVGIGQYFDTAERNFKRYFWERQLDVYERAVHLAAELSVERDRSTRQQVYRSFLVLYHGDMVIFEDQEVMQEMKGFIEVYIDYTEDPGLQWQVQQAARSLARACRESIAKSWDLELRELDFTKY